MADPRELPEGAQSVLVAGGAALVVRIPPAWGGDAHRAPHPLIVETHWADGRACAATREATEQNARQAREDGYERDGNGVRYTDEGAVEQHLVDHELLHNIVARDLWPEAGLSAALRQEAGDPRPYRERLYEEAVVLATQWMARAGVLDPAYGPPSIRLILQSHAGVLGRWVRQLNAARQALGYTPYDLYGQDRFLQL